MSPSAFPHKLAQGHAHVWTRCCALHSVVQRRNKGSNLARPSGASRRQACCARRCTAPVVYHHRPSRVPWGHAGGQRCAIASCRRGGSATHARRGGEGMCGRVARSGPAATAAKPPVTGQVVRSGRRLSCIHTQSHNHTLTSVRRRAAQRPRRKPAPIAGGRSAKGGGGGRGSARRRREACARKASRRCALARARAPGCE